MTQWQSRAQRPGFSGRCHIAEQVKTTMQSLTATHPLPQIHECTWRSSGCGVIPQASVLFAALHPPECHGDMGCVWRKLIDIPELRGEWEDCLWICTMKQKYKQSQSLHIWVCSCHLWKKINDRRSISSFILAASSCAFINVEDLENVQYFLTLSVMLQPKWNLWARAAGSTVDHLCGYGRPFALTSQSFPWLFISTLDTQFWIPVFLFSRDLCLLDNKQ